MPLQARLDILATWMQLDGPDVTGKYTALCDEIIEVGKLRPDLVRAWFSGKTKSVQNKTANNLLQTLEAIAADRQLVFERDYLFLGLDQLIDALKLPASKVAEIASYQAPPQPTYNVRCVIQTDVKIPWNRLTKICNSFGGTYFIYRLLSNANVIVREVFVIDDVPNGNGFIGCRLAGYEREDFEGALVPTTKALQVTMHTADPQEEIYLESMILFRDRGSKDYLAGVRLGLADGSHNPMAVRTIMKSAKELGERPGGADTDDPSIREWISPIGPNEENYDELYYLLMHNPANKVTPEFALGQQDGGDTMSPQNYPSERVLAIDPSSVGTLLNQKKYHEYVKKTG